MDVVPFAPHFFCKCRAGGSGVAVEPHDGGDEESRRAHRDDDRSGDFEPLAKVSGDKKVVLGLITSKKPELEDPEVIKARIAEAAQYVPLDRLCLSTQCGFASTEEGNKLTEEQQWAKIALVQSVAKDVWGE